MSVWTIEGKGTFAALHLANLRRTLISQAPDTVSFDAPGTAFDADPLFEYGETVEIKKDGVGWFLGRVNNVPRQGTVQAERVQYDLVGPWWHLTKLVYQQLWKLWDDEEEGVAYQRKSRVIIGQSAAGSRITSGAQITEVLEFAIEKGVPLLIGTIDPAVQVPWSEERDLSCADAIVRLLQFSPECACWFDYATDPPTFHCRSRANMSPVAVAAVGGPASTVSVAPRYDLRILGVTIRYEQEHEVDGVSYESVYNDVAGDPDDLSALVSTVELAGSRASYLSEDIEVGPFPAGPQIPVQSWWKARLPWLDDAKIIGLTIGAAIRTANPTTYPNLLLKGAIQDWMTKPESAPLILATEDTVTAEASYVEADADGNARHIQGQKLSVRVTATDAVTTKYKRLESFVAGEPRPVGLAAALLASCSALQYEGHIVLDQDECASGLQPGTVLNLTGGRPEWASMRALVQQVAEDIDAGRTSVVFGPAAHLGVADLVTLLRALRTRKSCTGWALRTDGKSEAGQNVVALGGAGARQEAAAGAGVVRSLVVAQKTGETTQKITVDPAAITKTDTDVDLKPRELHIITDVRYDTVNHRLEVKYRDVWLLAADGAESEWTMITGGQAELCDE